jgi:hypothetical protein
MKKIFTFAFAIASIAMIAISCKKGGSIKDELVPPGKDITHPDSTVIEVTIKAGLTPATQLRMVGDMTDGPNNWTPGSNAGCVVLDNVGNSTFRKQVAITFFKKSNMEFKFLRATSWGGGNEEVVPVAQQVGGGNSNRKISKSALSGKYARFTIEQWN